MEAHPVPQNVTAFEFHLIGDMTLKQFLYLSSGLGLAYLAFVFLASPLPIIAWPFIFLSSILGIAFAFIPISDRPLDRWLAAFLKAVYSPTKRVWNKGGVSFTDTPTFAKRLLIYHSALPNIQEHIPTPSSPAPLASQSTTPFPPQTPQVAQIPKEPLPSQEELQKTVELAKEAQTLQTKIIETERSLSVIKEAAVAPHADPQKYTAQINTILAELQSLILQAGQIKQQLATATNEPEILKAKVKIVVATPNPKQTQIILTSSPNVLNGIVMDSEGNYLDGVVVVIYDKEGLPVRALKTNKLGQFSGATPLPNGSYTIEMEKDNLMFDTLQIELDGKVLPPLQIAAKKIIASS